MKRESKRAKLQLFVMFLLCYSFAYICRLDFSAVMPELTRLDIYTPQQIGTITSLFFFCYGAGQMISGFLGDKVSPKILLFLGLAISGVSNILIGVFHQFAAVSVLWSLNGLAQSLLWPPIIFMINKYYEKQEKVTCVKYFTIAVPVGTLLSYGFSLLMLKIAGWKSVFIGSGALIAVISCIWFISSSGILKQLNEKRVETEETQELPNKSMKSFVRAFIFSGAVIMILPVAIHGALKDSVTNWVPTFISELFSTPTSLSLIITMILPIVNVAGGFVAAWVNKKIKNEVLTCLVFFGMAIIATLLLLFFGKSSLALSIICLALLTSSMFAINFLTISVMPLRFSNYNRVSTVSGLLNCVAYLGCAVINVIVGVMLDAFSWTGVMSLWVGIAALGLVITIVAGIIWSKFIKKDDVKKE